MGYTMNAPIKPSATKADIEIGKRLRSIRKKQEFTLSRFSEIAGLSYQQIQKYESGRNRISAARLKQFAEILDVPVTIFFDMIDQENWDFIIAQNDKTSFEGLWNDVPNGLAKTGIKILLHGLSQEHPSKTVE